MSIFVNIFIGVVFISLLILIPVGIYFGIKEHQRCTDNGGEWIRHNCRTIFLCSPDYDGNLQCSFEEQCDTKCVGADAEAR